VDLSSEYDLAFDFLDNMRPLLTLLIRKGSRLPAVGRIREVLAEGGVHVNADRLGELMDGGVIPARDAEAVATVVMMALVGYHLAEQFFGAPLGVSRDRYAAALASLVEQ
jgi:hypothetical protein